MLGFTPLSQEPLSSVPGQAGPTTHDATGALVGGGAAVAGSAARTRAHASTGTLAGGGAAVAGAAARTRVHASSGVLAGAGGQVAGAAARAGAAVVHDATGALSGGGAQITGSAAVAGVPGVVVTKGGIAQEQRRRREQDEGREQIRRDLERAMGVVLDEAPAPIVPAASEEQQEVEQVRRIKATYQRGAAQSVDWSALAADVQATQLILDLYERMKARRAQEDEDELLMMLM